MPSLASFRALSCIATVTSLGANRSPTNKHQPMHQLMHNQSPTNAPISLHTYTTAKSVTWHHSKPIVILSCCGPREVLKTS